MKTNALKVPLVNGVVNFSMFAKASVYNAFLVAKVFYVLYVMAMTRTKNASSVLPSYGRSVKSLSQIHTSTLPVNLWLQRSLCAFLSKLFNL